jgi:tether containing UBX domain for GLUT4
VTTCLTRSRNNNKPVDLARTFRQTALFSGAKLELVLASKSPSVVSVALQIPEGMGIPGGRLTDKFPSDTTLWLILRKFESSDGRNLNFTARGITDIHSGNSGAGRVVYEMPALNIMSRELSTFGDLQKTLAQLGVNSGNVLIRLNFKKTTQPLEEAMMEIGKYFKEEEETAGLDAEKADELTAEVDGTITDDLESLAPSQSPNLETKDVDMPDVSQAATQEPTTQPESDGAAPVVTPSEQSAQEMLSSPDQSVLGPNDRPIQVYAAPSSDAPKASLVPHNENDYEPSIAHAKQHQALLLNKTQNKRLLSDAEEEQLEKEKAARLASTKQVTLKIRFPDQSSIVSTFTADDTCTQLYGYVTNLIAAADQPFKLMYNEGKGPQAVPRDETKKLIMDLGFRGQILINFLWADGASPDSKKSPVLKSQYIQKARAVPVPEVVGEVPTEEPAAVDKGKEKETSGPGEGKPRGMPKWLKLGKK